nr:MAG TPA: hypothetical protein [Bacteriophage sp.]
MNHTIFIMSDDGMTANFGWVSPIFSCHCCHYFL